MTTYFYTDRLERPLSERTDVICDDCGGAILESEKRYPDYGTGDIFCAGCYYRHPCA